MEINPNLLARIYKIYEFFINQQNAVPLAGESSSGISDDDFEGIEDLDSFFADLMDDDDEEEGGGGSQKGLRQADHEKAMQQAMKSSGRKP